MAYQPLGKWFWDFPIIDHLNARLGDPLDRALDHTQRALALLARRTVEEHLYWCLVYARWVEPGGYAFSREAFARLLPPVIGKLLVHQVLLKNLVSSLHSHGLGRHARDDIYRRGAEDLAAIAVLLAGQPYFLGPEPTSVDASLYAFTGGIWLHPADNPLKQHMAALPNLVAYSERMHRRYFGERPPGRSEA